MGEQPTPSIAVMRTLYAVARKDACMDEWDDKLAWDYFVAGYMAATYDWVKRLDVQED